MHFRRYFCHLNRHFFRKVSRDDNIRSHKNCLVPINEAIKFIAFELLKCRSTTYKIYISIHSLEITNQSRMTIVINFLNTSVARNIHSEDARDCYVHIVVYLYTLFISVFMIYTVECRECSVLF